MSTTTGAFTDSDTQSCYVSSRTVTVLPCCQELLMHAYGVACTQGLLTLVLEGQLSDWHLDQLSEV